MIINSDFRDYYDNLTKTVGVDKTVVFDRKTQILTADSHDRRGKYPYVSVKELGLDNINSKPDESLFIGFCGKTYRALQRKKLPPSVASITEYYFDYDVTDVDFKPKWSNESFDYKFKLDLFHKFKTPTLILWQSHLHVNPCLKSFDFHKVVDPYSAFQDIQGFISGVLTNNPKIIEIADKDKIAAKGFNKFSFRHPVRIKDLT